jgi:predicted lipoprotein with Yx(FWY)xxD motif
MRIGTIARMGVLVLVAGVLAACGNDDAEPADDGNPTQEPTAAEAATVQTSDSDLGTILVDADGNTLYVFDADEGEESTCYDDCETAWPPLASDDPTAGGDADETLLGTTEREDGTLQVTYDGRPLYLFASDESPGDTNGQGVGDVWWVVGPDGAAIEKAAAAGGYERP